MKFMKVKFTIPILLSASLVFFSCSKDKITDPETNPANTLITKMTQGVNPGDDTVFVFNYDADKRIKSIINTSWKDTFTTTYNTAGLLSTIGINGEISSSETLSFAFDANKLPTQVNFEVGDYKTKWVFEYANGVISKISYYSNDFDGSEPALRDYSTYEVTNGNITGKKSYSASGTLTSQATFTYNTESNVFKTIALFNIKNSLGADDVADIEAIFNKNLVQSFTVVNTYSGTYTGTYAYTYNSDKQLTKVVASKPDDIRTRLFTY